MGHRHSCYSHSPYFLSLFIPQRPHRIYFFFLFHVLKLPQYRSVSSSMSAYFFSPFLTEYISCQPSRSRHLLATLLGPSNGKFLQRERHWHAGHSVKGQNRIFDKQEHRRESASRGRVVCVCVCVCVCELRSGRDTSSRTLGGRGAGTQS